MSPPRAQAALEFLTTYGWAFIIILASIAALAYFGVLDPSKFIPDRCLFGSEFECLDFSLNNSAAVSYAEFALINSVGETIAVGAYKCVFPKDATVSCPGAGPNCDCTDAAGAACAATENDPDTNAPFELPQTWTSGTNQTLRCILPLDQSGMVAGDKAKIRVELVYSISSTGYPHTVDGEVISTVSG